MRCVEGDMVRGVPVFGRNFENEGKGEEGVNCWGYLSTSSDGE